jgi:hypothetical protein
MKRKMFLLLAIAGFLAISAGFDEASMALHDFRIRTFTFTTWWIDWLLELSFAGLTILITWMILARGKDLLLGCIFIFMGGITLLLFSPYRHLSGLVLRLPIVFAPQFIGFLTRACALTLALGLTSLLQKPRNQASAIPHNV